MPLYPGDRVTPWAIFIDENGVVYDPDTVELTLISPTGKEYGPYTPTKPKDRYEYDFDIPNDSSSVGDWTSIFKGMTGTGSKSEKYVFTVNKLK